jgi:hypothetical protein
MSQEIDGHAADLRSIEPEVFAQPRRATWAIEQEHSFTFRANDMHLRRRVIVGVDRDPQTTDA